MIFFIGGAARTGKGIIARRLLAEQGLPYLSLDVLKMGVARGLPEYTLDPDAGAIRVAVRLWPLVREMCVSLIRDEVDYVMEGEILPGDVALLRDRHPAQVKACFLGYGAIAPAEKLREIRAYGGHPNDWPQEVADADLLTIIAREIAFSQYLQAECVRYRFPYFDTSHRFTLAMDEVIAYIRGN
jgi:hypothetical protein